MQLRSWRPALLALPSLATAVSLADLRPRASNLPSSCERIYVAQVPGCTAEDFTTNDCSNSCIAGLESFVKPIQNLCGNRGVTGENLIVAFLAGVGPQQLCHNAPPGAGNGSPAPGWGSQSWGSSSSPSSSSSSSTTMPSPTSATPTPKIGSSTTTAQSESNSSGSLLYDTSSTPTPPRSTSSSIPSQSAKNGPFGGNSSGHAGDTPMKQTPTAPQTAAGPASTTASSKGNYQTNIPDGSGGGSPFDTAGNMGSGASQSMSISMMAVLLSIGMIGLAAR